MNKQLQFFSLLAIGGLTMTLMIGCGDKGTDSIKGAVGKAEKAAGDAAGEADKAAKKMGEAAKTAVESSGEAISKLGEKAMGFLDPLKEEFGKLEGLVSEPTKLKQAASDLIAKLDQDMGGFNLPKPIADALNAAKEKLVALRDYITDEADPAQLEEKVKGVMESVKSALGMGKGCSLLLGNLATLKSMRMSNVEQGPNVE